MKYRNTWCTLKATTNIQGDSERKVNILGNDSYQSFLDKSLYVNAYHSEWLPREDCLRLR